MLDWLKKSSEHPPKKEIRDTLFGDDSLADLSEVNSEYEPWRSFKLTHQQLMAGHKAIAVQTLQSILQMPSLESRSYLQAWAALRELGIKPPPEKAKQVLGVVVEVALRGGLDLVAAWPDHGVRYYNYSGAGVVWERASDKLNLAIDDLLSKAQAVVNNIGPWEKPRPPAPPQGQARINILSVRPPFRARPL